MSFVFGYEHNQKVLRNSNVESLFFVYGKRLVIQFPYMKITSHRPFMQFFVLIREGGIVDGFLCFLSI